MESNEEELLKKYQLGICTPEEKALVESWYIQESQSAEDLLPEPDYHRIRQEIWKSIPAGNTAKIIQMQIMAAASILVVLSFGAYFLFGNRPPKKIAQITKNGINPGSNKATLTLSNGSQVNLSGVPDGKIAQQGQAIINKTANGQVVYFNKVKSGQSNEPAPVYNTISTPRGGQWQLTLPDGSKVWLNAASAIYYPVAFSGNTRKVKLNGEGYFEIAKDKAHPFIVETSRESVKVLGTHFNINSYEDEPAVRTTLLEGSVELNTENTTQLLKPGQQAALIDHKITIRDVDAEDDIAWKNGKFVFNNEGIAAIIRKISRWYDVTVTIESLPQYDNFSGSMSRFESIGEVLQKIELTNKVHFKIEGRRIIVMK